MSKVELGGLRYIGIDIVDEMVDINREKFAEEGREFLSLDLTGEKLPEADLILCRDCLVHLSFDQARDAIKNFKDSGIKYLLTTTFVERTENRELPRKFGWRTLNLELPPFNFPAPLRIINEGCTEDDNAYTDKSLGLWLLDDLF